MPHWIIETNWINREMLKGINEHYRSLKQACESVDDVKFIGPFIP